jgi:hypothetical protein
MMKVLDGGICGILRAVSLVESFIVIAARCQVLAGILKTKTTNNASIFVLSLSDDHSDAPQTTVNKLLVHQRNIHFGSQQLKP